MPPSPTCHFPNLFSSPHAQEMAQTIQKSFKSLYISSTRSSAHTLDLLWLALLLSPEINFNQILCTQLYSCLKPSKVLLLLRKPLPVILTLSALLPPSLHLPSPSLSPFFLSSKGQLWHHIMSAEPFTHTHTHTPAPECKLT